MELYLVIAVETLAVFIRFWLTTNPPLPETAQAAARAKAGERYEAFVTALGRRLAKGPKLRQEIAADVGEEQNADTRSRHPLGTPAHPLSTDWTRVVVGKAESGRGSSGGWR